MDNVDSRNSTPLLPHINTGYDTPASDYLSSFQGLPQTGSAKTRTSFPNSASSERHFARVGQSDINRNVQNSVRAESSSRKHCCSVECSRNGCQVHSKGDSHHSKQNTRTGNRVILLDNTVPVDKDSNGAQAVTQSYSGVRSTRTSPSKPRILSSASLRLSCNGSEKIPKAWDPPAISSECYSECKDRLLKGGKFKDDMVKYFRLEKRSWEGITESDDAGYDTDLDKQLGFELIADEKSRIFLEDGAFPEYKRECRKFRSHPNSYFIRHCLDDEMQMKRRYLSKGDSIALSNLIKNHLTLTTLDLEDNAIGPHGMKYFKEVLHENKHLTEMYLACNNLGPLGAKYLRYSLVSNCFLLKLDVSDNNFGEKGGKYIGGIIEDNVMLKELNLSRNGIGDDGATFISKALGNNISLKILDISWNNIRTIGALHLCSALKKNTELEVFLAGMNGFGDEGGRAIVSALRQNNVIKEVDLSANRINDAVLRYLTNGLHEISNLSVINLATNCLTTKTAIDFLTTVMARPYSITQINLEGIDVTDELKVLRNELQSVHSISVIYSEPPSKRNRTSDSLTRNLTILCEFMEKRGIGVDDLFPDFEEAEEEEPIMITIKEALCALEFCGRIANRGMLQGLKAQLRYGKRRRKFFVSELALVYDTVIRGKDPLVEQPLRTHLRRSIKAERQETERKEARTRGRSITA